MSCHDTGLDNRIGLPEPGSSLAPSADAIPSTRRVKAAERRREESPVHVPASTLPVTSSFVFPLVRCKPHTLSGLCLTCFPVPAASKDIPISAGSAVRVLLVAGQLISLSLRQTASLGTEITSNQLN